MKTILGTWKNGQVVLDAPADWPDGSRVQIEPVASDELVGMTEEEQADDPESLARWLATFDALEPLSMTPEEEANLTAWRQSVKAFNVEAVRRQMEDGIP
jgi:hypothetical protein